MSTLIARTQKEVLFEQAARQGITEKKISTVPEIYRNLLGISDVGQQRLGMPLAPMYLAVPDMEISIERIRQYFQGLLRDVQVLDLANNHVEDQLTLMNIEFWARMQLVKNRALYIARTAETERMRIAFGSAWSFSDTLTSTAFLDMSQTTMWVDTAAGHATLANLADNRSVPPQGMAVQSVTQSDGVSYLGSSAAQAVDGVETTNWRINFSRPGSFARVEYRLLAVADVHSIMIDPLGTGLDLEVEADTGTGWKPWVRSSVYSKTTFSSNAAGLQAIRVTIRPLDLALPRTIGVRNFTLFTSETSKSGVLQSQLLSPPYAYNEIRVDADVQLPAGSTLNCYYQTASASVWQVAPLGTWLSVIDQTTLGKLITHATPRAYVGGLWYITLPQTAINTIDGTLNTGLNQAEISAFKHDWSAENDSPKLLTTDMFAQEALTRTWTKPAVHTPAALASTILLQAPGASTLASANVERSGKLLVVSKRAVDPYQLLSVVPCPGDGVNMLQPAYNYRVRLHVFCTRDVYYEAGRYYFLQGYRTTGSRSFKELGVSYAAFSLYINGTLAVADRQPYTVYETGALETGASSGKPMIVKLHTGWNTVDLLMNITDTNRLLSDRGTTDLPYVQLSLMPSLLDEQFQRDHGITRVLGSGQTRPVTEFDLLWSLPADLGFWAWSEDRKSLALNANNPRAIDGFFAGQVPDCMLEYTGVDFTVAPEQLRLRFEALRSDASSAGPVLQKYDVYVR